jgi:hypothetical protein
MEDVMANKRNEKAVKEKRVGNEDTKRNRDHLVAAFDRSYTSSSVRRNF